MNEDEAYDTRRLVEDEDDGMGEHMEEGGFDGEDYDNSIECNDLIGEELKYDDAELLEIRGMNQISEQLKRKGLVLQIRIISLKVLI